VSRNGNWIVPQSYQEWTIPRTMDVNLVHFYCMRNKNYIVYKFIYTLYTVDI
jgi:hypothetical protein